MARIRKGDEVLVRAGADAGKRGRVLRVLPGADRAVVEGVNFIHKHLRKGPKNPQGGRVRREASVHLSKLMIVDPSTDKPTRVGSRVEGGKKVGPTDENEVVRGREVFAEQAQFAQAIARHEMGVIDDGDEHLSGAMDLERLLN